MRFINACQCGAETECKAEDQSLGAVFQCPKCKTVRGCVRPRGGGSAWVEIDPSEVAFYRLLTEPEDEEA